MRTPPVVFLSARLPRPLPSWAKEDYVNHNVAEFQRTGFHGGLNYYRAAEPIFELSAAFKGAKIAEPSFFIWGEMDRLKELYPLTIDQLRDGLPGLVGGMELDNIGHSGATEASRHRRLSICEVRAEPSIMPDASRLKAHGKRTIASS